MQHRKSESLVEGLCFGEGPRWRNGRLWFSDMYGYKVFSVDLAGEIETITEVPKQPSGLGWLPNGDLLFVSMLDRRIMRLGPDGTKVHSDLSELIEHPCNDMIVDAVGNAYVGNYGFDLDLVMKGEGRPQETHLVCVTPEGDAFKVGDPLLFPNGMVITPDGGTLIVAETFGARLTAFDLSASGELTNGRIWASLEGIHPDGITLDADGAIWIASPRAKSVFRIAEGGQVLEAIELEQDCFACMLGGEDGKTLFMLTAGTFDGRESIERKTGRVEVVAVDVPKAGLP